MSVTNTIKPAGGGDYTTAQAWENAVDGLSADTYIAECYEGGDCGTITFGSWMTGSIGILRAAAGNGHNGSLSDGAYITSASASCVAISVTSNITVQGLRLKKTGGSTGVLTVSNSTAAIENITIDGNLVECARAGAAALLGIYVGTQSYNATNVIVRNNIVVTTASNGTGATGISFYHIHLNGPDSTLSGAVHNNTVICNSLGTYGLQVFPEQAISGTANLNATVKNNVVVGSLTADCRWAPTGSTGGTITGSNNATSDGTADVWGGTGHVENIVAADTFTNPTSDWSLLSTSSCVGAGADLSGTFTTDAYGNTRSVPWNIGAWEGVFAPVAAFSGTPLSGSAPLSVSFTDASSNSPTSWSWDFGDSGTSTSQNPTHEYATPGDYTVALTATNAGGSDAETKVAYVSVSAPASAGPYIRTRATESRRSLTSRR